MARWRIDAAIPWRQSMSSAPGPLKNLYRDYLRQGRSLRDAGLWALAVYRYGVWSRQLPRPARWITSKIYGGLVLALQMATGTQIYRETRIGEDLHLVHAWNVLIHPDVVIGDRCTIMHEVTLGTNEPGREGVPRIGNDVFIAAGAKILGPVTVGDGAVIASNSLVLSDIPPGTTAIGVPARLLRFPPGAPGDRKPAAGSSQLQSNGEVRTAGTDRTSR
jgi:serine O-acetyltransferase